MIHSSRFVSRSHSRSPRTASADARRVRSAVEALESRRLFAAGDPDATFAGDGEQEIANTVATREGHDVVALPDGKMLVAGTTSGGTGATGRNGYVAKFNANGSLDTSFGVGGRRQLDFGSGTDAEARHIVVRPDGKILVAGIHGTEVEFGPLNWGLALLNADGTFDTAFGGGDGRLTIDIPGGDRDWIQSISVTAGNKIVAGVESGPDGPVAMRLNADASPDMTFGGDGFVTLDPAIITSSSFIGLGHVVAIDGGVFLAGHRALPPDPNGEVSLATSLVKLRADGTLDPAWGGGDGYIHDTFSGEAFRRVALAPGGKIVASGYNSVGRFLAADGTLDNTFAGDGRKTVDAGVPADMAVAADGRIYLAGSTYSDDVRLGRFTVRRLKADGAVDNAWSGDAVAHADFSKAADDSAAMALGADGKVVVVGTTLPSGGVGDFEDDSVDLRGAAIARFTTSGAADSTFSGDGKLVDGATVARNGNAVAVLSNGNIVVAGSQFSHSETAPSGITQDFFLQRLKPDGSTDTTFGNGGRVTTDFGGTFDTALKLLALPDGKILAAGQTRALNGTIDLAVARYNANGTLDTSFSGDGKLTLDAGGGTDTVHKLALRHDGDVLLSVQTGMVQGAFTLVRLNPSGSLDSALAGSGIFRNDVGAAFLPLPDGKILLGGQAQGGGSYLTRLNANGSTDTTFNGDGRTPNQFFGPDVGGTPVDLLLQNGKVLVLVSASPNASRALEKVALYRLTLNGDQDPTFVNGQGTAVYGFPDSAIDTPLGFAPDPAGRIVILARPHRHSFDPDEHFAVLRVLPDGLIDNSFGTDGRAVGADGRSIGDLALMPDGRPVVVGTNLRNIDYPNYSDDYLDFRPNGVVVNRLEAGPTPSQQTPYHGAPFRITDDATTTIQAEDFDRGGEGVAYHDLTPTQNVGGRYRSTEGVDIKNTTDGGAGGFRLSDAMAREWLEYTIDVVDPNAYDLQVRVGSPSGGGALHLEIDGVDVTGRLNVPITGGYDDMVTLTARRPFLTAGTHVLRLALDRDNAGGAAGGINWMAFVPTGEVEPPPAEPVVLRAGADAYVRDGSTFSGTNFGGATQLQVKQGAAGWNRDAHLRFDLSSVDTVSSATLRLFGRLDNTSAESAGFQVYNAADTTWSETGITWDDRPAANATLLAAAPVIGTTGRWYELNLTPFLQSEKAAGRDVVTLVIKASAASPSNILFDSDEAGAATRPELVVVR